MSAYGMYCLKKSEQLIKMANLIAALSFDAFDCNPQPFTQKYRQYAAIQGR